MFLVSQNDLSIPGAPCPAMRRELDHGAAVPADPTELVEWEMTAGQVGSLIAAMALIFGVVSLFG